jgi:Uma2 family endonuclease
MGDALEKLNVSIEEYIEMDESSLEKLEYHAGEVFAMAGGSPVHSLLGNNVGYALTDAIKKSGKPYNTFNSDIKVAVSDIRFMYPDAAVVCGKMETSEVIPQAITNPTIIVEVLSPSTALYDREGKFQAYQKIKSFREHVLISQENVLVEVFYKAEGWNFWKYRSYTSLEDSIMLESIDVIISMQDIYLGWEKEVE